MSRGRGGGKTYAANQWVNNIAEENPGSRIAYFGITMQDLRHTVRGLNGTFNAQRATVQYANGTVVYLLSAANLHRVEDMHMGRKFHFGVADNIDYYSPEVVGFLLNSVCLGEYPELFLTATDPDKKHVAEMIENADEDLRPEAITHPEGTPIYNAMMSYWRIFNG